MQKETLIWTVEKNRRALWITHLWRRTGGKGRLKSVPASRPLTSRLERPSHSDIEVSQDIANNFFFGWMKLFLPVAVFCPLTADSNIMNGVLKDVLKIRYQLLNLKKTKKKRSHNIWDNYLNFLNSSTGAKYPLSLQTKEFKSTCPGKIYALLIS